MAKRFFLAEMRIGDLHREDAVVAVLERDVEGRVALGPRRLELPGHLGELHVVDVVRIVVDIPLEDADDDALGRIGHRVIRLRVGARYVGAALDDRIEVDLPPLVDRIGAQRMLELDAEGVIVEPGRSLENRRYDGGSLGDAGHRIDAVERLRLLAAELVGDVLANQRDLAGAADEQDLVDVARPEISEAERLVDGGAGLLDEGPDDPLEFRPIDRLLEAQLLVGNELRLASDSRRRGRQVDLRLLDGEQELRLVRRVEQIVAGLVLEALRENDGEGGVDVVAAELADPLRRQLLEDAVMDAEDGHIKGAAAEVVDENGLVLAGVEPVGDGGRGRLVDEREHLHAGGAGADLGGVPGQALRVGGDRDDRLQDRLLERLLGVALQHAEEHGGDLFGAEILADEGDAIGGAEEPLDGADGAVFLVVSLASWPKQSELSRRTVTTEGVHLRPSRLGSTSACPYRKLATTELLVPKSMPT